MKELFIDKETVYSGLSGHVLQDCDPTEDSDYSDTVGITCITCTGRIF